jgi:hypothetical protein
VLLDDCRDERVLAVEVLGQLRSGAVLMEPNEWDASDAARRDATADEAPPYREVPVDEDAGKSAAPALDVREQVA